MHTIYLSCKYFIYLPIYLSIYLFIYLPDFVYLLKTCLFIMYLFMVYNLKKKEHPLTL